MFVLHQGARAAMKNVMDNNDAVNRRTECSYLEAAWPFNWLW
jgi:hypothetical protein